MKKNIIIPESLTKEERQSPVEIKYTIVVAYSIRGIPYSEIPSLSCMHKLFDTIEQAISAVSSEIEEKYNNLDYIDLKIRNLPKVENGYLYDGYFTCIYKSDLKVEYIIRINTIYL